jgi:hypothetical protein
MPLCSPTPPLLLIFLLIPLQHCGTANTQDKEIASENNTISQSSSAFSF